MKPLIFFFAFLCLFTVAKTELWAQDAKSLSDRVEKILAAMTLDEKIDYIGGYNSFYIRPIERLGLPEIKMSDGPVGVRNYGPAAAFPAGIAMAASWDTNLVNKIGQALGKEARARGVHILLAPGVNIYRAPMCGRNFEYFGEDPYLSSQMTVSYIRGVQAQKVVATVKHYTANNQEYNRHEISSDVDERTLREIYLQPFKAAVRKGHVGAVMTAYNLVNGIHCSQHDFLINQVLKKEWGFKGIVMSDWASVYDGLAAAKGGLDLEMPSAAFMNKENLLPALKDGSLDEKVIDDKVRRILRLIISFGFLDYQQTDDSIPLNNPESAKIALDAARNGIVLLKNENDILPLNIKKLKNIAVIGPNAHPAVTGGGGSSYTQPFAAMSVLDGIKTYANHNAQVNHCPAIIYRPEEALYAASEYYTDGVKGMLGEYYNNMTLSGKPVFSRTDEKINFDWSGKEPGKGLKAEGYSVRWTGKINIPEKAEYVFYLNGDDGYRLYLNGALVIEDWSDHAPRTKSYKQTLTSGTINVAIEFYQNRGGSVIRFGWGKVDSTEDEKHLQKAVRLAEKADAVILCLGFNREIEKENSDRPFSLPSKQLRLIKALSAVNPNCIAVVNAGGNVDMQAWINDVQAVLHAWYPGQEGGTAVADIIFGTVNPSAKLPISIEKSWQDNAVFSSYYDDDNDYHVRYSEGVFLGYRHFDKSGIEPLFPFGFGLSYTSFIYENIRLSKREMKENDTLWVSFDITNTGKMAGKETAQLYIGDEKASVPRPVKELKGFSKILLQPGETKTVRIPVEFTSLAFYDPKTGKWRAEEGMFKVLIGTSSKDIRLETEFNYNQ